LTCPNQNGDAPTNTQFGGERNPMNIIYVFDASYCKANGILGVALSDGTLRLMNGRGVCLSVLQLPGSNEASISTHLTSFSWDPTGQRLATTVATGHLITWNIELINPLGMVGYHEPNYRHSLVSDGIHTTCSAVMDGGHNLGKPLYGCLYIENGQLLISYGSDGRICLWDSGSIGEIHEPIAVLWDNNLSVHPRSEGYPIYALSVTTPSHVTNTSSDSAVGDDGGSIKNRNRTTEESSANTGPHQSRNEDIHSNEGDNVETASSRSLQKSTIVIAGGGTTEGGLLGTPVYLQDVYFWK
jgi:WD40 repeat protein